MSRIAFSFLAALSTKNIGQTMGAVRRGVREGTRGAGLGWGRGELVIVDIENRKTHRP